MQDFRITNTHDLPDTTELVRAELQQLQVALRSSQRQIQWQIHQALSSRDIEKRIKMLKWGNVIGTIMQIGLMVYVYMGLFADNAFFRNLFVLLIGAMMLGNFYFIHIFTPKRMRQNPIFVIPIALNLDKQKVIIHDNSRQQRSLKFHSKSTLPAFILPHNADADLRHLRDEVQNHLTQITGLAFASS